ncbi:hypothetical protein [Halorussus lipolyticus]|uniref:hypothetical protein n=1 Tax=Halorussus lipolyticus TaxID=3034024 RepID=UPI0023E8BF1A|nr:hypothetical protein [Halorussus sp. DT80]
MAANVEHSAPEFVGDVLLDCGFIERDVSLAERLPDALGVGDGGRGELFVGAHEEFRDVRRELRRGAGFFVVFEEDCRCGAVRVKDVLERLVEGFERGGSVALGRPTRPVEVGLLERGDGGEAVVGGRGLILDGDVDRGVSEGLALVGERRAIVRDAWRRLRVLRPLRWTAVFGRPRIFGWAAAAVLWWASVFRWPLRLVPRRSRIFGRASRFVARWTGVFRWPLRLISGWVLRFVLGRALRFVAGGRWRAFWWFCSGGFGRCRGGCSRRLRGVFALSVAVPISVACAEYRGKSVELGEGIRNRVGE